MKGRVACAFEGGPWNGKVEELAAMYCLDTLSVLGDVWIAERPDGGADIHRGERGSNWIMIIRHIYRKLPQPSGRSGLTYKFVRSVDVHRCRQHLALADRRCKNEAVEGAELCKQHLKKRSSPTHGRR